jgi:beta-glucanase (GH16 family)
MSSRGRHQISTRTETSQDSDIASRDGAVGYPRRSFIKGVLAGAIGGAGVGAGLGIALDRVSQGNSGKRNSGKKSALTWNDEFNGPSGAPPDPAFWSAVVNGGGGGNQEREYYVPSANALDGKGNLVVTAVRNSGTYQAWYGPSQFTSGKILTQGRLAFRYGHLEVGAAFPCAGQPGAWPAIWLLGANYSDVGWPACGEIDVLESFGKKLSSTLISGAVHSSGGSKLEFEDLPEAHDATQPHVYTLDWNPESIEIGVDGKTYVAVKKEDFSVWPFSQPFFLILNLAIGGVGGGDVPSDASLPYTARFDYVRLYGGELYQATGPVG